MKCVDDRYYPDWNQNLKKICREIAGVTGISIDVATNVIAGYIDIIIICCGCGYEEIEYPSYLGRCHKCQMCQKIYCTQCEMLQIIYTKCTEAFCIDCAYNNPCSNIKPYIYYCVACTSVAAEIANQVDHFNCQLNNEAAYESTDESDYESADGSDYEFTDESEEE
ncbi:MAG: hypothetical protein Hyperionvirus4_129 [Hyperionvirus sp.]|uniref:Uncharacterized protein n=1 Tax=Hyperionvirus sp. TaxID=2487770 RepID=A0A3G5A9K4_9VIRU|nr:MAG: hypothetical protein Hyperionvirus4_129 [Hyperionvirus sp.]